MTSARIVAAACITALLTTGCEEFQEVSLTHRVWSSDDFRRYSQPAPIPNLEVLDRADHQDLLVRYDAKSDSRGKIERRAYMLEPNRELIASGERPQFLSQVTTNGMSRVPVLTTNEAASSGLHCVVGYPERAEGGVGFRVYREGMDRGAYALPVYTESAGTTERVLVTPLAVAGDAVMVGSVVGIIAAVLWANGVVQSDRYMR
jgi:hypothetical protein